MTDASPFGWDSENSRPILRFDSEKALDGIELRAFGSEYEEADTMFAVFAGEERILTLRPEPLLLRLIGDIIEKGSFTMEVRGNPAQEVTVDDDRIDQLQAVRDELKEGLEHAPLGQ